MARKRQRGGTLTARNNSDTSLEKLLHTDKRSSGRLSSRISNQQEKKKSEELEQRNFWPYNACSTVDWLLDECRLARLKVQARMEECSPRNLGLSWRCCSETEKGDGRVAAASTSGLVSEEETDNG